ncbi:MAG TPA: hypothetical protein VFQ53_01080 [Kofleriaceae bacterium]|nr:hypothetical protein [Kofleriaceae bacterium]
MNRWLRVASVLTLIALALMVWSLFDRTLIPVMVAMTVAQALGTAAFAAYGYVVFRDVTKKRAARVSREHAAIDPAAPAPEAAR